EVLADGQQRMAVSQVGGEDNGIAGPPAQRAQPGDRTRGQGVADGVGARFGGGRGRHQGEQHHQPTQPRHGGAPESQAKSLLLYAGASRIATAVPDHSPHRHFWLLLTAGLLSSLPSLPTILSRSDTACRCSSVKRWSATATKLPTLTS